MPMLPSLAIAGVLWLPLIGFTFRRDDTGRLLLCAVAGAILAALAATLYVGMAFDDTDYSYYPALLWLALMWFGAPIGAYLGVALAETMSSDSHRAHGARSGLAYGLGVALLLCVALGLILELRGGHLPHVLVGAALLSLAVSTLFGSQMALTERMPRAAGDAAHRLLTAGCVALIGLVLGLAVLHRLMS